MKKVVIFARVSSTNGTQDYERQINDLKTLASANNWTVEAVFAEKVSGAKKNTERKTIRERVASGYQNFRSNGGKVGRKAGYSKSDETMKEEYAEEIRLLKRGYSLRNTSKLTGTSINTLRKLTQLT